MSSTAADNFQPYRQPQPLQHAPAAALDRRRHARHDRHLRDLNGDRAERRDREVASGALKRGFDRAPQRPAALENGERQKRAGHETDREPARQARGGSVAHVRARGADDMALV